MADLGEKFFEDAADEVQQQQQAAPPPPTQQEAAAAPPPPPPPAQPAAPSAEMDAQAQQPQQSADSPAPASGVGPLSLPTGIDDATIDPQTLGAAGAAAGLGVAKGLYATKDFFATGAGLFSDPPTEGERSALRQSVDAQSARLGSEYGAPYSLTEGLAQGAVGLLGAGKLAWGGAAVKAAVGAVGAAASFEPHAANFANLAQNIPGMDGPVTRFFASDEHDSAAWGYIKNALTSIGVEGAAAGLFAGTAGMLKALRSGDQAAIEAASADLQSAVESHQAAGAGNSRPTEGANPGLSGAKLEETPSASAAPNTTASPLVDADALSRAIDSALADQQALIKHGSWDAAIANGHTFGSEDGIPWQIIGARSSEASAPDAAAPPTIRQRLEDAYLQETGGETSTGVGLDKIRARLSDVPRDEVDGGLAQILKGDTEGGEGASLMRQDDSRRITPAMHSAAYSPAGDPFHVMWLSKTMERAGAEDLEGATLDAWTARVRDEFRDRFDEAKGGAVQTDAMNQQAVEARVALWNEDPAQLLGALHAAGQRAGDLRADMMAGFTIAQRLQQDSFAMASRIKIGALDEWGGSLEAAHAALQQRVATAIDAQSAALSISSNAARALRGLRSDFRLTPEAVQGVNGLDRSATLGPLELSNLARMPGENLVDLLTNTAGDPMALSNALRPKVMQRIVDGAQLFLVNNLLWNPLTHAIIFGSNAFQALARPAMRAAGSTLNGSLDTVGREALKSYYYLATSIPDAYRSALQAFRTGDSVISPHDLAAAMGSGSGGSATASGMGQAIAQAEFRWNNVGDILRNTLLAGAKTLSFPTRAVGFQDELVKQVVYRAKVQASALVEGQMHGLTGDELNSWVKGKLYDSFDGYGRATDKDALKEAATATFQNDLNPTGHIFGYEYATQGYKLQQYLQGNAPARIILPFMRTPVNLYRQSVQLTPGLNMLQSEYRDAILGVYGAEHQARAIGQMGMGTLIAGTAATLAYQGLITGNAPLDPKLAAEAMQDGWRPNSIVIPHKDGTKTYIPFDRFDPVMMPFGMAADIVNVLKSDETADQNKAQSLGTALGLTLYKALADPLYLQHIDQVIQFALNPDRHGGAFAGGLAANYVPFSSALHLVNPDPVMREADTFVSAMLGKVPGFSKDFGARRDWAGDPITVHKGLWHDTPADAANAEVERLALQQGASLGAPSSRTKGGADFRDVTLAGNADREATGKNAYDRFQELAGHPERMPGGNPSAPSLRATITQLIGSPEYQSMPDGGPETKGTKISAVMGVVNRYREGARRFMASDVNVRQAEQAEIRRVATVSGYAQPNMPTPTNTADGVINRLGKMFGFSGAHVPSPVDGGSNK